MRKNLFLIILGLVFVTGSNASAQTHTKKGSKKGTKTNAVHNCAPSSTTTGETDQPGCGSHCGTERWRVKTVSDDDADKVSTTSDQKSVADLLGEPAPGSLPQSSRLPIEKTQVRVDALLIGRKIETKDKDFHLVIANPEDPTQTMIAEIPNPVCTSACQSKFIQNYKDARAAVVNELGQPTSTFVRLRTPEMVHIIGIPFFDFDHGQTGLAVNCIEIHPVLSIAFASPGKTGASHKKSGPQKKKK
jgi:hypothetical protein